jgi:excisionase family DNA binding protein
MTDMLTAKDIQKLLQVDRSTIYRMAEQGRLPALKVGKQWRFPQDQVERWLNKKRPAVTPESEVVANDLVQLLPLACVQLIQDTFADTLGVMLVVTDMQGRPITEISQPAGLVSTANESARSRQACIDSWRDLATAIEMEPRFRPGYLGLLWARGLVRVGRELKGMVVAGAIAPKSWPPPLAQGQALAEAWGLTVDTFTRHSGEVVHLSEVEQAKTLLLVQRIADIIAHIVNERNSMLGNLAATG